MTTIRVRAASATDVGRRRQNNQDTVLVDERLFAVADGMGGYAGGEVASLTAIETLRDAFRRNPTAAGLEDAVRQANQAVIERASREPDLRQMGTTLDAVALVDSEDGDGEVLAVAHVGDSRIYLLRDGDLTQLTDDHTVSEEMRRAGQLTEAEAEVDRRRHILTRVLGPRPDEQPDMQTIVPYTGDRVLVCSDGLYNEVPDNRIASVLRTVADPDEAAARLVELANRAGGGDNISVVLVDVVDDDDRARTASRRLMTAEERNAQLRELSRDPANTTPNDEDDDDDGLPAMWGTTPQPTGRRADRNARHDDHDGDNMPSRRVTLRVVAFLLGLAVIAAGAVAAIGWYARGSYFVGLDDGRVAIFEGRPGGLLWFHPTVEERTDLTQAAVPTARAADVERGHEVASIEAARRYVTNLRHEAELLNPSATASTTTPPPQPTTTAAP
jgi:serine/threonine protein phosphatase PrpC